MLDPAVLWETVPGEIGFECLPKLGKNQFKLLREKALLQTSTDSHWLPHVGCKAHMESEGQTCPTAASAPPQLRDSLCQCYCAAALGSVQ